jgi:hypothetical protein
VKTEELHDEQEKQEKTSKKKQQYKDRQQSYEDKLKAEFLDLVDPAVKRAIKRCSCYCW